MSSRQAAGVTAARPGRDGGVGPGSASFDETLPFPPPLHRAVRSVETERGLSGPGSRGLSLEQLTEASLARAHVEQLHVEQLHLEQQQPQSETPVQTAAMVRAPSGPAELGRLHWRGRELSPEFHEYALRVSRGENLEPFRGQLLAGEGQELPWESIDSRPLRSKAPRVVGLLMAALALVAAVSGSLASHEEAPAWSVPSPAALAATLPEPAATKVAQPASSVESSARLPAEVTPAAVAPAVGPAPQVAPRRVRKAVAPAPVPSEVKGPSPLLVEVPPF